MFQTKQMLYLSTQIILLIFEFSDMRVVLELGNFLAGIFAQKKTAYKITTHLTKWKNGDGLDFLNT
jgi:hypothetical protein